MLFSAAFRLVTQVFGIYASSERFFFTEYDGIDAIKSSKNDY